MRLTETTGIGEDSRVVAASLAAPLLAAAELGIERLTLADLILLPRDTDAASTAISASWPILFARLTASDLLRAGDTWHRVRAAERFEQPGCLGNSTRVGIGEAGHVAMDADD